MLTIDGVEYDVKCEIRRTAEISASDISGLLLDRSYFNDVLGTYMSYELVFSYPLYNQNRYTTIYDVLSAPVDGHTFMLPYNQGVIEITARVEKVYDEYYRTEGGRVYWRETAFDIIANHPSKYMSLTEVLARGRAPLPEVAEPREGDTWTWHNGAWGEAATYDNADDIYY